VSTPNSSPDDSIELVEAQVPAAAASDAVWNSLSLVVLIVIAVTLLFFGVIFANPQAALNPFPPPTLPAVLVMPTEAATPTLPPATAAPEIPTAVPATNTPEAPTRTPMYVLPTSSSAPAITETEPAASEFNFISQAEPQAVSASLFVASRGCDWLGVAGQVLDLRDSPLSGTKIELGGYFDGKPVSMLTLSGTAVQYGPSGYEFTISDQLIASHDALWVRLLDQADLPLSARVVFDTSSDCARNLVVINFRQVK